MSFDPTGGWNPTLPVLPEALAAGKAFLAKLPKLGPGQVIHRGYFHWTAAPFGCEFSEYNGEVDLDQGAWRLYLTHTPLDNAVDITDGPYAAHTAYRNSHAVGLAIAGMSGATVNNFGADPLNRHELEFLCAGMAAFCAAYDIDAMGTVEVGTVHDDNNGNPVNTTGEHNLLTHAECAVLDAYPTERIDLGTLVALPLGVSLTPEMRVLSGNALRVRTHVYKVALL